MITCRLSQFLIPKPSTSGKRGGQDDASAVVGVSNHHLVDAIELPHAVLPEHRPGITHETILEGIDLPAGGMESDENVLRLGHRSS